MGMSTRIALVLLVAACGEPLATSPDASATATDFVPPPPDAGLPNVPVRCIYLYPPVHHAGGSITSAETWLGAREHIIDGSLAVSAHITVQGCSQIRIAAGSSIELRQNGSLQPPTTQPGPSGIVFEPLTTAWGRIRIDGGAFSLNGASIIGGGLQVPAALTLESGQLSFQGLTITNSTNLGLQITGGSLTGSALTVTGSTAAPVQIPANMVGNLPTGGTYTGNAKDEIVVPTTATVTTSQTWHNVGVPYHLQGTGRINVDGGSRVAVLTIDPGTTLAFDLGGELDIDPKVAPKATPTTPIPPASGALHAVGLPGLPIVFTSSGVTAQGLPRTKTQGDWQAIYFGDTIDTNTQIDQARIEFAGGPGGGALGSCTTPFNNTAIHDAAVRFRNSAQPTKEFITNTTITDSPTNGIDRSYQASSDAPDFTATNTFVRVPECHQTHPAINGGCPSTPQCD